ncbi:MAG: hypothetical protein Q9207_005075 [Kuettlingeria erythrocarpa]
MGPPLTTSPYRLPVLDSRSSNQTKNAFPLLMAGPAEQRPTKATSPEIEFNNTLKKHKDKRPTSMARHLRPHVPPPNKHQKKWAALVNAFAIDNDDALAAVTDVAWGTVEEYPVVQQEHLDAEGRLVILRLSVLREGPAIEVLWSGGDIPKPQCIAQYEFWGRAEWKLQYELA